MSGTIGDEMKAQLPVFQIRTISSYERLEDVLNKGADDPDYEVFQVLPADGIFRDRIILKRKTTPLTKPVRKSYT
jgi:hypothetical protein